MKSKRDTPKDSKSQKMRYLTCGYNRGRRNARVPHLRITGKWLQKAGFEIGNIVSIEEKDNSLVITPLPLKWKLEYSVNRCAVDETGNKYTLK